MLRKAATTHQHAALAFVQGDATMLPSAASNFDSVFMLGGIHHVRDRSPLFLEVARILKPGGHFYFREPVSDFVLWRAIRAVSVAKDLSQFHFSPNNFDILAE